MGEAASSGAVLAFPYAEAEQDFFRMQEKVYLGIKNHDTGDYYVTACTLPAQIGRQHDMRNQVLLDPRYRTISRIHGMIERTPRGFVYTDSSTSGSRVGGLVVRDSRVALSPSFQIEIENYTVSRVDITPFVILSTTDKLDEVQALDVLPGRGIGVAELAEVAEIRKRFPSRQSPVDVAGATLELVDLNRWTEWDIRTIGRFELGDQGPVWVTDGQPTQQIRRNKSPIPPQQERTPLVALDVLEVGSMRFEVLHPHEPRVVCGYERCHLLNPPPLEANCRFCGRHLANAGGFSRIL
ncbi:MAG: FHA domain-containing protein [Hyphomicrobiaceae bacterium]|nr:FHA domain-containing protein [Hyphomicrobiaceae bacterium]